MHRQPIFKTIFGEQWDRLPAIMQTHYANRGYTSDEVTVTGQMNIELSRFAKLLSPFMRVTGVLAPYSGRNIPVTVHFQSEKHSNAYRLKRIFHYPGKSPYYFQSRMLPKRGNEVIEYMHAGLGWHAAYSFDGQRVRLVHRGYVLKCFGRFLRLPLEFLLGKAYAEEWATSADSFNMQLEMRHPYFGQIYTYSGQFTLTSVHLDA
jgi:hypothetical protein